jgi:hypothetical protein
MGIGFGCFIPSLFFADSDINNPESAKEHLFNMSLTLAIISTMILIPVLIFLKDRPTEVNSIDVKEEKIIPDDTLSLWESIKILIKDNDWVVSTISHSLCLAYYFSFTTVITPMISVYGFTSDQASYLSSAY